MKKRDNLSFIKEQGVVIWFTGLSGAGKSTLANTLLPVFGNRGRGTKILDGDEVRKNITSDLGFSKKDRSENIKRISFVAKIVADVGGIAIVAAISPYKEDRDKARCLIGENRFFEIHVDCHIDTLIERDVKGLYKKAIDGDILNFTGISDPYEVPKNPNCIVHSDCMTISESIDEILKKLEEFLNKSKKGMMFYI